MSDTAGWKALTPEQLEAKVRVEHGDAAWEAVQRGLDNHKPKWGRRRWFVGAKERAKASCLPATRSPEPNWLEVARYKNLCKDGRYGPDFERLVLADPNGEACAGIELP